MTTNESTFDPEFERLDWVSDRLSRALLLVQGLRAARRWGNKKFKMANETALQVAMSNLHLETAAYVSIHQEVEAKIDAVTEVVPDIEQKLTN